MANDNDDCDGDGRRKGRLGQAWVGFDAVESCMKSIGIYSTPG